MMGSDGGELLIPDFIAHTIGIAVLQPRSVMYSDGSSKPRPRRITMNRLFAPIFLALLLLAPPWSAPASAQETSELWIDTAAGPRYRFEIELAVTPQQQATGLMNRPEMAADAGMLFVFEPERPVSFWMKNTLISLDMLFVGADGRIVNIGARTEPLSLASVPSDGPVGAVLEINGGLSAMLGIRPGDKIVHPAFPE